MRCDQRLARRPDRWQAEARGENPGGPANNAEDEHHHGEDGRKRPVQVRSRAVRSLQPVQVADGEPEDRQDRPCDEDGRNGGHDPQFEQFVPQFLPVGERGIWNLSMAMSSRLTIPRLMPVVPGRRPFTASLTRLAAQKQNGKTICMAIGAMSRQRITQPIITATSLAT
ncbi:hypothetical protein ACIBCS_41850 [Streptomyces phaeochromogenes]|uniref:hypothetical protein n=1 Tax=Streptomyces phaeochromogenes TaxID=1923 RepID=UPI0033DF9A2C